MGKPTAGLDTHELAWAAGFFDGEGSVCLRRRGNWRELWLQVAQSGEHAPAILQRFQRAVGEHGGVRGPWMKHKTQLPVYRFDARGYESVQAIVAMLWRFLSEAKRQQASAAMRECRDYHRSRPNWRGSAVLPRASALKLRAEHAAACAGRQRVARGWIAIKAAELGIKPSTVAAIVQDWHGAKCYV